MRIELPQVGESVTEGVIGRWLKQVGDPIERFDPLVEVVTDKVNMEMPSPVSGVLTVILANEGDTVPMGAAIAEIRVEGEPDESTAAVSADAVSSAPVPVPPRPADTTGVLLKDVAPVGPTGSGGTIAPKEEVEDTSQGRRRYSPVVRRLAAEHDVDLSQIGGTGIGGRVTRKDVQGYIDSTRRERPDAPAPTPERAVFADGAVEERVPLTPIRRMIAANMVKSATQIPQAWGITEIDVSGMVRRREAVKDDFRNREGVNITYLPFVMKAVAESLKENPLLNSSWDEDAIILKKRVNIGIAVAAPSGLIVPVIHDADTLSIAGLAHRIDDLSGRARQGKLSIEEVQGGTFTLNNTGALGSIASQPIINHPQAAILTTEAIVRRPVAVDDAIAIRSMMNICLTFDHRIIDGAEASSFTNAVKRRLEAMGPDTGVY